MTDTTPEAVAPPASAGRAGVFVLRLLSAIVVPIVAFTLLWVTFDYLRDENANRFIVVGVALVVSRVMRALLFGVSPTDPMTYAAVSGALAAVMLLAMYLPARGASRVDPVVALRADV